MERALVKRQEAQTGSIRDFLTVVFKHKTKILIIFFSIVLATTLISLIIPPVFETKTTLLVKYGREYLNQPEVGTAPPGTSMYLSQEEIINSEVQILRSPELAKKVIEALRIENMYPELVKDPPKKMSPMDAAVIQFGKSLAVEGVRKSNVINVSFRHEDPRMAAKTVNKLVELYKVKHLEVFSTPHSSFLEGQVAALRQKLAVSQNNMESYKQKNRVYSLEEQRTLLLKQRTDLDTELLNTRNTVDELERKLSTLRAQTRTLSQNKSLYTPTERDKIIVDARSRLLALQLSEQELLRKYTENNRLVVDTRKEIQMVKNFLGEQEKDIQSKVQTGNVVYQEAHRALVTTEADLSAQKAKLATLGGQLKQLDGAIKNLDLSEKEMLNLKRELTTDEKNYQAYSDKMEEARLTDDMNRLKLANISVIQPALVPVKPLFPRMKLNVALSIVFGALGAIGYALFSERNSHGLVTPEIAEKRLNLVVLAAIPYKE
jgi:uncharacterized protein involved in exopolysaccharide biosynthesis